MTSFQTVIADAQFDRTQKILDRIQKIIVWLFVLIVTGFNTTIDLLVRFLDVFSTFVGMIYDLTH